MSYRFSSTDKWRDSWFSRLTPEEKLLFLFLLDNCDLAGFYEVDNRMISFLTGLNEQQIIGAFKGLIRGYLGAKGTGWIWIKNFLRHQKNTPLNEENNAHKHIIQLILAQKQRFNEHPEIMGLISAPKQGLISPIGKGKVKVRSVLDSESFEKFWSAYPKKKSKGSAQKWWTVNKPGTDTVEKMIVTIGKLKGTKDWQKDGGQFIPHPATWLNSRGWEDEVEFVTKQITAPTEEEIRKRGYVDQTDFYGAKIDQGNANRG